ncbi:glycoside hydrolase family 5 protein [Nocardia sp. CDC160]|uniref:glycoside hydrolase family 5 protein n=1 Tax=Nocardia sp. CDC160 TaxID=3112166 RepID=UPI002DBF0478|nr:cellulase family glycosylhydrolase [Nocardia sp. CDC160]MEC3917532.1 cellulase family glycosylhydrolase [Nocardia sp. CDC160]
MGIHDTNRLLARTINIGLDLGADIEQGWTLPVGEHELDLCREAGFTAVRLGVCWAAHTGPGFQIDATALERVATLAEQATERGLALVLTNFLDPELMADPPKYLDRLLSITEQVTTRFAAHPESILLEPLAEPREALDALWNDYIARLLTVLRKVDPHRAVIVGPGAYNNARTLPQLELPTADRDLIVTVHQYWPITFTMQGEEWLGTTPFGDPKSWLGNTWDGTPDQRAELTAGFDGIAAWAAAADRPIFLGEFGTSVHADNASRARWTAFNRLLAEERGFSWGAWSFGPTFALYNAQSGGWNKPLLTALTGDAQAVLG